MQALRWINGLACIHPWLDAAMLFLTFVSTGGAIFIALAALLSLWPARRRTAATVVTALALGGLSEELIKLMVQRPRPYSALARGSLCIIGWLPTSSAFPSGHATIAFAVAAALWQRNRYLGLAAALLAVLIALSRVYLGQHYPSDVLAGALLGVLTGLAAPRLLSCLWPVRA